MNQYDNGDLVEAVKGETIIRGRLTMEGQHFWVGASDRTVSGLTSQGGYTITVIEKAPAKIVLPDVAGAMIFWETEDCRLFAYLDPEVWLWSHNNCEFGSQDMLEEIGNHSITVLAPVPAIAKTLLDRFSEWGDGEDRMPLDAFLGKVSREFGVSE